MSKQQDKNEEIDHKKYCFVIMPISELEDRNKDHFKRVYEDIFKPACVDAGYEPLRADDVHKTNFIQLDIVEKLIESPMAICDLSTRNPNVLYELGMRQAFDKPTVLVRERNTPKIFDIDVLRYTEYNQILDYRDVLKAQHDISSAIKETEKSAEKGDSVNSLVKLMGLKKAEIIGIENSSNPEITQLLWSEIKSMRNDLSIISANQANYNNTAITDSALKELDSFDRGITQLENAIKEGLSENVLRGLYETLNNEHSRLNFSLPNGNMFHLKILGELWHRLMMVNNSRNLS